MGEIVRTWEAHPVAGWIVFAALPKQYPTRPVWADPPGAPPAGFGPVAGKCAPADADLIAAARNALVPLLDALDAAEAEGDRGQTRRRREEAVSAAETPEEPATPPCAVPGSAEARDHNFRGNGGCRWCGKGRIVDAAPGPVTVDAPGGPVVVAPGEVWTSLGPTDAVRRERLGRLVREVWIAWAREQPNPKPSWLAPWEGLSEPDREVDRRIGERLAAEGAGAEAERWRHATDCATPEEAKVRISGMAAQYEERIEDLVHERDKLRVEVKGLAAELQRRPEAASAPGLSHDAVDPMLRSIAEPAPGTSWVERLVALEGQASLERECMSRLAARISGLEARTAPKPDTFAEACREAGGAAGAPR